MNQMEQYFVVRRTEEKDEQFAVIDAMSLAEAKAIFKVRYDEFDITNEEIKEETFFIFKLDGDLKYDENNRVLLSEVVGDMAITSRWQQ
ncbi:hypothetical protein SAMN04487944_1172 [Gracilibacillus ureilyticus]|uniref:Uncharacterized protein n=1 Tax=Gracilibacillus ureilyticus TaxID=531814 RepID=A0A1H9UBN9_9BACI|nr:hypothetical protein [Gracilibacillus ureilyticus]SES06866.1 hypothetical protein SAMN04487944_1172 [Gracilibacillus ureilyticus]